MIVLINEEASDKFQNPFGSKVLANLEMLEWNFLILIVETYTTLEKT